VKGEKRKNSPNSPFEKGGRKGGFEKSKLVSDEK